MQRDFQSHCGNNTLHLREYKITHYWNRDGVASTSAAAEVN